MFRSEDLQKMNELSDQELKNRIAQLREEQRKMRFARKAGQTVGRNASVVRKTVARILTVLSMRRHRGK